MSKAGRSQTLKYEPHAFRKKICHWEYCQHCGLVALRNDATAEAIRLGCNWYAIERARKGLGQ